MFLRFFFASLAGSLLLTLQIPSVASACSCMERPAEDLIEAADIVIEGEFFEETSTENGDRVLRWRVTRAWKAEAGETLEIHSAISDALCGYQPVAGRHYIVLAARDGSGAYRTGLCSGNELADSDEGSRLLSALGVGITPFELATTANQQEEATPPTEEPLRLDTVAQAGCQSCSLSSSTPETPKGLLVGLILIGLTLLARRR